MKIKYIVLHHSAVSYDKNPDQFEANNRVHKKWGVKSSLGYWLGYNYEISMDGITRQARREGERTVACWQQGMNNGKAIHICLDGNFSIQLPTIQQKNSLIKLLKELQLKYPNAEIKEHRNFANTQCPGLKIKDDWAKDLISKNKNMILTIDKNNDQYLVEESSKFAVSIADEKMLEKITSHFVKNGIELEAPALTNMKEYLIIRGATKKELKEFFNI